MLFLCDCAEQENRIMDLHGEVMACGYEDVQVMWSILDKSKSSACNITSSWHPLEGFSESRLVLMDDDDDVWM